VRVLHVGLTARQGILGGCPIFELATLAMHGVVFFPKFGVNSRQPRADARTPARAYANTPMWYSAVVSGVL
jgi:hypothetical protein